MAPLREHALARSPWVERFNRWLESAWSKGLSSRPSLDPEVLWAKAHRKASPAGETTARDIVDVADFRQRLERLTDSLKVEAKLTHLG